MTQPSGTVMGLLHDAEILRLCEKGMITPHEGGQVREESRAGLTHRVISYGLTSYGYDIRAGNLWDIFDPLSEGVIDPKNFNHRLLRDRAVPWVEPGYIVLPANSYALCSSVERFHMPDDVVGIAVGKSSYARCGIIVNVTPLEPGWRGFLTIEVSNCAPRDAKVYVGEGLLQVQFWRGERPQTTYADRGGKYQDQAQGPVHAKL